MTTHVSLSAFNVFHPSFLRHLSLIGTALIASSLLYLLASHWFFLPDVVRLGLPMGVLIITAFISSIMTLSNTVNQTLHTLCALMIGLSLAVIGQIYQTGADSFWLFTLWSALLIPWLYRHNIGVFAMLSMTSLLALYLFFKQNFYGTESAIYLLALNSISLVILLGCLRWYLPLRYGAIALIWGVSLFGVILLEDSYSPLSFGTSLLAITSIIGLPLYASWRFWKNSDQIPLAFMLCALAVNFFIWLLYHYDFIGMGSYFLLGVVVLLCFFALGMMIINLFPKGKFHHIPIGVGAWIAGLIFAMAFLTYWEGFSMLLGALSFGGAVFLLHTLPATATPKRIFVRHLSYCFMICGQIAFLVHLGIKSDNLLPALLAQCVFAGVLWYMRAHWSVLAIQGMGLYLLSCLYVIYDGAGYDSLTSAVSLSALQLIWVIPLFCLQYPASWRYARGIWVMIFGVMILHLLQSILLIKTPDQLLPTWVWLLQLIASIGFTMVFFRHLTPHVHLIVLLIFALLLTFLGYFEIFIIVMGIIWALTHQDKLLHGLYVLGLAIFLGYLYYSLQMSFLAKSATIFILGLFCLGWAALLHTKIGERQ